MIITSNQQSMANLGAVVPVDVFPEQEALAFLTERTGSADAKGLVRWPSSWDIFRWRWRRPRP